MESREEKLQIPAPSPSPWLVYTHGDYKSKNIQTFCTVTSSYNKSYIKSIPDLRGKRIHTSSNGWLILADAEQHTRQYYLWDPLTCNLIKLPRLPSSLPDFASTIVINTTSTDKLGNSSIRPCMVLFLCEYILFWCRLIDQHNEDRHDVNWVFEILRLEVEGSAARVMEANIADNKVIYAVLYTYDVSDDLDDYNGDNHYLATLQLTLKDEGDNSAALITLGSLLLHFPTPTTGISHYNCIRNYLIESCGDIYLATTCVVPYTFSERHEKINDIKFWQLDFETLTWVDVRSIGDRAFFLNSERVCTWCWANKEAGVEPNSAYILDADDKKQKDTVYLYRLHDHSLTLLRSTPHLVSPSTRPSWVVFPHHHQRSLDGECRKPEAPNSSKNQFYHIADSEKTPYQNSISNDLITLLPGEMIAKISESLHLFDFLNLRTTCKSLRSQLPLPDGRVPLFILSNNNASYCQVMHPFRNDSRSISIPRPSISNGKFIDFSKKGWLLFDIYGECFKYLHIFTGVTVFSPSFNKMNVVINVGFSTTPTVSDCFTLAILDPNDTRGFAYRVNGEKTWSDIEFTGEQNYYGYPESTSCPIFLDGGFYFLNEKDILVFFKLEGAPNLKTSEREPRLTVYDRKPKLKNANFDSSHLVECEGQLLSVYIGDKGKWVQVFKFDLHHRKWFELKSLGNNILFISKSSTISMVAPQPSMGNRIYLPWFYRNDIVYYSLETCKFHTLGSEHSMDDLYGTTQPFRCCWA